MTEQAATAPPPAPAHVVLMPLPVQSHLNPFNSLAHFLVSNGVSVTFVHTTYSYKQVFKSKAQDDNGAGAAAAPSVLDHSHDNDDDDLERCFYRIEVLPDAFGDRPYVDSSTQTRNFDRLKDSLVLMKQGLEQFLDRHRQLSAESTPENSAGAGDAVDQLRRRGRPVSALIMDSFIPWGYEVASKYGLPKIDLWTSNAIMFTMGLHIPQLKDRGFAPASPDYSADDQYEDGIVDFVPGLKPFRVGDLPCMWRSETPTGNATLEFVQQALNNYQYTNRILVNSLHDLEGPIVEALKQIYGIRIDCVGPLPTPGSNSVSFLPEDASCLTWLQGCEPRSVLYVSFGSLAHVEAEVFTELALGVEASGVPFLWVVRPDSVGSSSDHAGGVDDVFPDGFRQRTCERGLVVSWAPQPAVLAQPAVGAFLSHCGWNSTMESLAAGVPILGFPLMAEQNTNLKFIVDDWGAGLPLLPGLRCYPPAPSGYSAATCDRVSVQKSVEAILSGAGSVKERALQWKNAAAIATSESGSSCRNLQSLVDDLKNKRL